MSYCRWSSDNWQCAVYCYEDVSGGFTTHVAGNKPVGDIPHEDTAGFFAHRITVEEYMAQHNAVMKFLETAKRAPIGLPCDGQSFNDPDMESFLSRLLSLKEMGYNVPDWVIESVKEEIADEA